MKRPVLYLFVLLLVSCGQQPQKRSESVNEEQPQTLSESKNEQMEASIENEERILEPISIITMPKITLAEWEKCGELLDEGDESQNLNKYGDLTIFEDMYSGRCSWYCGGEVKSVTASSCLQPVGSFDYKGENAHDFSHESVWATKGKGIGESLTYTFEGKSPRIREGRAS